MMPIFVAPVWAFFFFLVDGIGRIGAILAPTIAGQLLDIGWDKQSLYVGVGFVMLISTVALFFLKSRSEIKA